MVAILHTFTHGKHMVTVCTTSDRRSKLPERRLFSRIPYEEYPTAWEYTEAVEAVTDQVATRLAGRPD